MGHARANPTAVRRGPSGTSGAVCAVVRSRAMAAPHGRRIRVFVVEDHEFFRRGILSVLEKYGLEVVGESGTAEEALAAIPRARPDVVLMDLHLPGMSGTEATARLTGAPAAPRVVMITVSSAEDDLYAALVAGATGYLLKDAPPAEIVAGVREAAQGGSRVSGELVGALVDRVRRLGQGTRSGPRPGPALSGREREVLEHMVLGEENAEIAAVLGI